MNVRRLLLAVPVLGAALATAAVTPLAAQPTTFGGYCTDGPVPQSWGDVPGRLNFSNRVLTAFGDGSVRTVNLTGSGAGVFGPLACANYGGAPGEPNDVGEIAVITDGTSNTILLGEVTLGGRTGAGPRDAEVRVYDGGCKNLRASRSVTIQDGTSNTILLGEVVRGPACVQWNDPWFAGVGSLTVTAVPEPATDGLTLCGLAALVFFARRRARPAA